MQEIRINMIAAMMIIFGSIMPESAGMIAIILLTQIVRGRISRRIN